MMTARKMASLVGAVMVSVAASAQELTSEPMFVFLQPGTSSFWHTATNNTMTVPIDCPSGATSASLSVNGVGYSRTYEHLSGGEFTFALPASTSPETENVYELTLAFDNGVTRTARLGLVQGQSLDSEGATRCLAPYGDEQWGKVRGRAVLPIPYGTEIFNIDGVDVDTKLGGAQGWYAIEGLAPGESCSLELSGQDPAQGEEGEYWHYFVNLVGGAYGMQIIFL